MKLTNDFCIFCWEVKNGSIVPWVCLRVGDVGRFSRNVMSWESVVWKWDVWLQTRAFEKMIEHRILAFWSRAGIRRAIFCPSRLTHVKVVLWSARVGWEHSSQGAEPPLGGYQLTCRASRSVTFSRGQSLHSYLEHRKCFNSHRDNQGNETPWSSQAPWAQEWMGGGGKISARSWFWPCPCLQPGAARCVHVA